MRFDSLSPHPFSTKFGQSRKRPHSAASRRSPIRNPVKTRTRPKSASPIRGSLYQASPSPQALRQSKSQGLKIDLRGQMGRVITYDTSWSPPRTVAACYTKRPDAGIPQYDPEMPLQGPLNREEAAELDLLERLNQASREMDLPSPAHLEPHKHPNKPPAPAPQASIKVVVPTNSLLMPAPFMESPEKGVFKIHRHTT